MLTGAADTGAGEKTSVLTKRKSALRSIVAKRNGFFREVMHHAQADGGVELIHVRCVVGGLAGRAALQDNNGQRSSLAELFSHEQTGPAAANDNSVDRRKLLHCSSSLGRTFAPVAWRRLAGLGRKALP